MKPALVLYTHTDYKDIWPMFFGQANLHLNDYKKIVFVNKHDEDIPNDYEQIYYDEGSVYPVRVSSCLSYLDINQPIVFLHEDMILFNEPNHKVIEEFTSLVVDNKADFIKLIKAGQEPFVKSDLHNNLVNAVPQLLFSIQPTICKVSKLKHIYLLTPGSSIWDFESRVSDTCRDYNYTKCFMSSDDSEKKRGLAHWDSSIFPYIATAIIKGKWNYKEYKTELDELFSKYNIDKDKRGTE